VFSQKYEAVGAKIKEFHMVMGQYDMVAIVEAPDDATFARALLTNSSKGGFQSETLRAFRKLNTRKLFRRFGDAFEYPTQGLRVCC
jgi:uncharacterized protein with GYD domain